MKYKDILIKLLRKGQVTVLSTPSPGKTPKLAIDELKQARNAILKTEMAYRKIENTFEGVLVKIYAIRNGQLDNKPLVTLNLKEEE